MTRVHRRHLRLDPGRAVGPPEPTPTNPPLLHPEARSRGRLSASVREAGISSGWTTHRPTIARSQDTSREPWPDFDTASEGEVADPERSEARWLEEHCRLPMSDGAVLLHAPSQVFQAPGGGENQLLRTGIGLETLGLRVRPFVPWSDRLDRARVLHLFGMSHEGLELARVARSRRTPVVLSPICWLDPSLLWMRGSPWRRRIRDGASWILRRACPLPFGWRSELLALADAILPNSAREAAQLVNLLDADAARVTVVPNGVDPRFAAGDPGLIRSEVGDQDFVLYVGRIEPRKNVLGLIWALRTTSKPLVVIGDAAPGQEEYAEKCRRAGRNRVHWISRMDHCDPRLASAYAAARVFALASHFETPGLAALEAALAGSAVVITPYGSTREYFGDHVRYARPHRLGEIAQAVEMAWEQGPVPDLAEHVATNYLWSEVARATAEVYDQVAP